MHGVFSIFSEHRRTGESIGAVSAGYACSLRHFILFVQKDRLLDIFSTCGKCSGESEETIDSSRVFPVLSTFSTWFSTIFPPLSRTFPQVSHFTLRNIFSCFFDTGPFLRCAKTRLCPARHFYKSKVFCRVFIAFYVRVVYTITTRNTYLGQCPGINCKVR